MSASDVAKIPPAGETETNNMKHDRRNSGVISTGSNDSRYNGPPPSSSPYHPYYHHPHHYSHYYHHPPSSDIQTRPTLPLQSVVTTSFSTEEREAGQDSGSITRISQDQRYERRREEDQREDWHTRGGYHHQQHHHIPRPSQFSSRAYSSPGYYPPPPLKRNYYHHSRPSDARRLSAPSDFSPPKRAKVDTPSSKHKVVTPRQYWHQEEVHAYPMARSGSYPPAPWAYYSHPPPTTTSPSVSPSYPRPAVVNLGSERDQPPRWVSVAASAPGPWVSPPRGSPPAQWNPSFDSSEATTRPTQTITTKEPELETVKNKTKRRDFFEHVGVTEGDSVRKMTMENGESILLLALTQDRSALSETLCVVRENIEIFTASQEDVDAPAPGRKHAVSVGQVGLRCIHCRHTTKASDRVKRAVCYPSSIKRIYRTVIDMKLDHFSQCKFVPKSLQHHLNELKSVQSRSTGTTMQYFIQAAHILGMEDAVTGVRFSGQESSKMNLAITTTPAPPLPALSAVQRNHSSNGSEETTSSSKSESISASSFDSSASAVSLTTSQEEEQQQLFYSGMVSLALPEDKSSLSPLRCFLREQVCAFSATEDDIAVRAPTTFSIKVGQVGIGCIHCVKQESKYRSNRAVCFPFSIGRIYQSVADIQRFHLGECKMMPAKIKQQFLELQSASSKGSKGLATRQYWVTAAKKIGLVDTAQGLRFGRDPMQSQSPPKAFSLDILAQAAFNMTTASKELVKEEDKESIAEFLYVVMQQLRPCRFTEADRNKRRLKDVGCIGVECKHCAGQVDGRKFFWSSVSAVESNFVSVHTHMLECQMIPEELKNRLIELKALRKEQTAVLKSGSQKAFFARVWQRLHDDDASADEEKMQTEEERELSDCPMSSAEQECRDGPADNDVSDMASSMEMVSV